MNCKIYCYKYMTPEVSNMNYIHLTIKKRSQIEILKKERYFVRKIASLIGVHHSTVARELNRIEDEYSAIKAQQGGK